MRPIAYSQIFHFPRPEPFINLTFNVKEQELDTLPAKK